MTTAGVSRMSPEHAEFFRGIHWAGSRDWDSEPILPSGLLRELMRDVWLPAHLIADWCWFRNIGLPPWLPTQPADVERSGGKAHAATGGIDGDPDPPPELPMWLTPMEAVAWIVARDPRLFTYASPERNAIRSFVINHVLPNGKRVSGQVEPLPAGISLLWLDAFAALDTDQAVPTERALEKLHAALRAGRIVARGVWAATDERLDMGSDEWRSLTLDSPPRNERVLLPHRVIPGMLAKRVEVRWKDVLLPTGQLLELWPGHEATIPVTPPQAVPWQQSLEVTKQPVDHRTRECRVLGYFLAACDLRS